METKSIIIDLELSKMIEAFRKSFSETENDILKRIVNLLDSLQNSDALSIPSTPRFFIHRPSPSKDVNAIGTNSRIGFTVLKGSKISMAIQPSMPVHYKKLRESLIDKGIIDPTTRLFQQDFEFKSVTAASSVILGASSDGHRDWREKIDFPHIPKLEL